MERLINILRCIYAEAFWKEFERIIKRECNGCRTEHESQDQHEVCMNPEKQATTPQWYKEAWDMVNKDEGSVHFVYYQTVVQLQCPHYDLHILRELVTTRIMLIRSDYSLVFKSALSSADDEEIQSVRNQLERLEKRLKRDNVLKSD